MAMTTKDLDMGLNQSLLQAYAEFYAAQKAVEAAEAKLKQLTFAISMITERDKTNANRNPE